MEKIGGFGKKEEDDMLDDVYIKCSESILKNIPEHGWRMAFTTVHTYSNFVIVYYDPKGMIKHTFKKRIFCRILILYEQ